jgi:2-amino-4-hydroxy-6-hydroxymethyldihydropteridine diphosphokinase
MQVYLGIGSNIDPEPNIKAGLRDLVNVFGALDASNVYESAAVGFDGPSFLNLAVGFETDFALADLRAQLRAIELAHGRPENASRNSSRTLDIDILLYGDFCGYFDSLELPRPEIHYNAFVLRPLAELTPTLAIPSTNITLGELWSRFDQQRHPLISRSFQFNGRCLPAVLTP